MFGRTRILFALALSAQLALSSFAAAAKVTIVNRQGAVIPYASVVASGREHRANARGEISFDPRARGTSLLLKAPGYAKGTIRLTGRDQRVSLNAAPPVKALYLSHKAYTGAARDGIILQILRTMRSGGFNALVIDFKNDDGEILSAPDVRSDYAKDPAEFVRYLKNQGIYTIARIVTFKDSTAVNAHPAWGLRDNHGGLWMNRNGSKWMDPGIHATWDYVISKAQLAVDTGFDEIQFDYVRLASDGQVVDGVQVKRRHRQPMATPEERAGVIGGFLRAARAALAPRGVFISADTFGYIYFPGDEHKDLDGNIGQTVEHLTPHLDYISPMAYPSHYREQGLPPDARYNPRTGGRFEPTRIPERVVYVTVHDIRSRMERMRTRGVAVNAIVRPWLQDFNNLHSDQKTFEVADLIAQLRGNTRAQGSGYMLWDVNCQFPFTRAAIENGSLR